ncbi:MAG TPA: AAA family ATPase, partial [Solirubrobacterales bacterium]|nr:AAA family ATPase [Solirubrobacterales bacterium]
MTGHEDDLSELDVADVWAGDDLNYLLERLDGVRPCGADYWSACCPAHDDSKASLTFGSDGDGRVWLRCHAGCSFTEIVERLPDREAIPYDHRGGRRNGVEELEAAAWRRSAVTEATYDYRDEWGKLLYQVIRKRFPDGEKSFVQRQPITPLDSDEVVEWDWTKRHARRVLFRLPDLYRLPAGSLVFVVEGEKDALALAEHRLFGTMKDGGSSSQWLADFNAMLRGKRVVVIPDNDRAGHECAERVLRSLHQAGIEVYRLDLPGEYREKHGLDVSDWFAAGGTREQLLALLAETPHWMPGDGSPPAGEPECSIAYGRLISLEESLRRKYPPWEIEGLIRRGDRGIIWGPGGAGKTYLAVSLACSTAAGEDWFSRALRPGPVVYVAAEDDIGTAHRAQTYLTHFGLPGADRLFFLPGSLDLLDARTVTAFLADLDKLPQKPALVVVDNLGLCFGSGDEKEGKDAKAFADSCERIQLHRWRAGESDPTIRASDAERITVLILHHGNKQGSFMGSARFRDYVGMMSELSRDEGIFTLTGDKQRHGVAHGPIRFRLEEVDPADGLCVVVPLDAPGSEEPGLRLS